MGGARVRCSVLCSLLCGDVWGGRPHDAPRRTQADWRSVGTPLVLRIWCSVLVRARAAPVVSGLAGSPRPGGENGGRGSRVRRAERGLCLLYSIFRQLCYMIDAHITHISLPPPVPARRPPGRMHLHLVGRVAGPRAGGRCTLQRAAGFPLSEFRIPPHHAPRASVSPLCLSSLPALSR